MVRSKKLQKFITDNNLEINKNLILKDGVVLFKLWHDNTLFFKEKKWSINFYKNGKLKNVETNVGGIGQAIKRMSKAFLSQNKARSVANQ
jgi:hypothetical protein